MPPACPVVFNVQGLQHRRVEENEMPPACPVESHGRGYYSRADVKWMPGAGPMEAHVIDFGPKSKQREFSTGQAGGIVVMV